MSFLSKREKESEGESQRSHVILVLRSHGKYCHNHSESLSSRQHRHQDHHNFRRSQIEIFSYICFVLSFVRKQKKEKKKKKVILSCTFHRLIRIGGCCHSVSRISSSLNFFFTELILGRPIRAGTPPQKALWNYVFFL